LALPRLRFWLFSALALLTIFVAERADARALVVVLTSEEEEDWTRARLDGLRDALGDDVALAVEGVGLGRLADPIQVNLLKALLRIKYADRPPAAVAALDDDAAAFLADARESLFPQIPAVFSRLDLRSAPAPAGRDWAGGLLERADIPGVLAVATALQPDLLRLAVINTTPDTPVGRAAQAEFRRQVRSSAPPGVELIFWDNVPAPLLIERLNNLSGRDAVLSLSRGGSIISSETARRIKAPIYGVWEEYGDQAASGGCFARGGAYGKALGGVLREAMLGVSSAGVVPSPPSVCIFDGGRLAALNIDLEQLPAHVAVINPPSGLLPNYRAFPALYWTAGMASFGLAAVIAGLLLRLSAKEQVRREAETLARRRAEQWMIFQETMDEAPDAMFVLDEQSLYFTYVNRGAETLLGYSEAELLRMSPLDIDINLDPTQFRADMGAMRRGERGARRFQTVHRRDNGMLVPVEVVVQYVPGRNRQTGRFIAVVRDISEFRAVEANLRADELRYELALATTGDGVWEWDLSSGRVWFSTQWKSQLGYGESELENSLEMWRKLLHPDDAADALRRLTDFNEGRMPAFDTVLRFRHRDGRTVYIHSRALHQKDASGRPLRLIGVHTDMTERRLSRLRLQESESRLRELAAAVPGMMFQWIERRDGGHNFVWVSPRARDLFGVDADTLLADWTRLRIHPDDLDMWRASLETAALTGVDWEFECRILRGEGSLRWVKGLARPENTPDGVLLNGIFLDVTGERLLREEMDRLRTRLDFLLNASPAIICAATADGRLRPTFLSAGIRQFGYQARRLLGETDWWLTRIHPDDRVRVQNAVAGLPGGEGAELNYRFRTADGDWRWIVDHRVTVRDADGRPLEVVGTMIDVSRVVLAERQARLAQERLEQVLQSAGEGIYGVDAEGKIIFANAAALRMIGVTEEEMRGAASHALFHHSHEDGTPYPAEECSVYRTARDGVVRHVSDEVFRRKDGDCFPVEYVAAPLRDGTQTSGAVVVFRDVTEALRVRRELQNSLQRWEAVLSNSPVGIAVTDMERRFVRVNDYLSRLLGASEPELIGRSVREAYADNAAYEEASRRALPLLMQGAAHQDELELRRSNGESVWVSVTGSLIDVDAPEQGCVWVLEDISQRKAQELALQEKTIELERSNTELEAFAYVASHDLRQPLRVVNSYLSLLQRALGVDLSGDAKEFLDFARAGAQRMDRLIVDLLEYSRVGRRTKPSRRLESAELAAQALRNLEFAVADAGGQVTIGDNLPAVVGDESELERLFQNLIGNAVKYHAPNRPPEVSVTAQDAPEGRLFIVADNGIGIAPNHLERVFGIFQRLHTPEAYEGSGIGLAICRKIVERHGGRIWVESVEGEGSAFKFILPAVAD
jgi:PAS domain S-box-containing protein